MKCPDCQRRLRTGYPRIVMGDRVLLESLDCYCGFRGHLLLKVRWRNQKVPGDKNRWEYTLTRSTGLVRRWVE